MKPTLAVGSLIGLVVLLLVAVFKPWKKPGDRLRNQQGVGPTHVPGVPRDEAFVGKEGRDAIETVAGRIPGSVQPN